MKKIEVIDGKVSLHIDGTFSAQELADLVSQLGEARQQIAQDPATPEGLALNLLTNPAYWTTYQPELGMTVLTYKDPAVGWTGVALPPAEVARLVGYFGNQLALATTTTGTDATAAGHNPGQGGNLH